MDEQSLKELLDTWVDRYNRPEFIEDDPIAIPHAFASRDDIEIAGFLVSTIAWGNREAIVRSGHRLIGLLDHAPADYVRHASQEELHRLRRFVHRTFNGEDVIAFLLAIRSMMERFGGIGLFFEQVYRESGDMRVAIDRFRIEFFRREHPARCEKHLSCISRGAACKRLNMYIRWMVREDDRGVDFGLWKTIPPAALYLPLDLHSGEMGRALGLLHRKQNDWKAVEEITVALRRFDAADPVRYDFALFGAGMSGFLKCEDAVR